VIEIALYHATQGYRVFPLMPGEKPPVIPRQRGGRGCLDATADLDRIERWWAEYPNANVGIATGDALLVIDVDPRKCDRWLDSLHELALPPTFTIRTWSGGWHLYFSMPPDGRITIGSNLLPGIDWRGNGGYVVGAGSIVKGIAYTIAKNKNLPIAAAPAELLERIRAHKKLARPVKADDGHYIIPDGQRNETLFAMACLLRRFGIEFNAIFESLRAVNADQCTSALEDDELRTIAASAMRYVPRTSPRESA
jgi:hypothetical protein